MRILIVGVIIRKGAFKTDTFIMLGRWSLPVCVIRLSSRRIRIWIRRRRVARSGLSVAVLRLSVRSGRS